MHHDAEQIEQLFGGADPAREDNDAVTEAHEGFQPLLDIRQDHQLVDDGVGRFGRNDGRLCEADVAAVSYPLFGMADGGPLHRALHGARATAGTDVQLTQAQFAAHGAGVLVFDLVDGVATPADDQVGVGAGRITLALRRMANTTLEI